MHYCRLYFFIVFALCCCNTAHFPTVGLIKHYLILSYNIQTHGRGYSSLLLAQVLFASDLLQIPAPGTGLVRLIGRDLESEMLLAHIWAGLQQTWRSESKVLCGRLHWKLGCQVSETSQKLQTEGWSQVKSSQVKSSQVKSSQVKFIYIAHFKTTVVDQSAVHKYSIKKNKAKNKKAWYCILATTMNKTK